MAHHPPSCLGGSVTSSTVQELRLDQSTDPATKVALTRNDIAHQSVQALLDDLDYVTTKIPAHQRADAARAVLDHHRPPVSDALLSDEGRQLQSAARSALHELAGIPRRQTFDDVLIIPEPAKARPLPDAPPVDRLRQIGLSVAMTGGIAAGGFAVGAILQRLF